MVRINKPIRCPLCNHDMINYSINKNTGKIIFVCCENHSVEMTEEAYIKEIQKSGV